MRGAGQPQAGQTQEREGEARHLALRMERNRKLVQQPVCRVALQGGAGEGSARVCLFMVARTPPASFARSWPTRFLRVSDDRTRNQQNINPNARVSIYAALRSAPRTPGPRAARHRLTERLDTCTQRINRISRQSKRQNRWRRGGAWPCCCCCWPWGCLAAAALAGVGQRALARVCGR